MTPLDKTLKRSLKIKGSDFVITLSPLALKVTQKGHRLGFEMLWESLVNGDRALAVALQASVGQFETSSVSTPKSGLTAQTSKPKPKKAKASLRSRRR
jgi:hypothetical protein